MKSSRIAQETARVVKGKSLESLPPRRQTRAFAASLRGFSASDLPLDEVVKQEVGGESDSDPSSPSSIDIEDLPFNTPVSKKRKRELKTPSTAVTTISTSTSTRTSPRKAGLQEGGAVPGKIKKARRQPAKKVVRNDGTVQYEAPLNWEEVFEVTREMRKNNLAPVDTMGCERIADPKLSLKDQRFQTLISLMISSQTKDTTNALTMRRLQTELPAPGLTLKNILEVEPDRLNELIWAVGFHNNKTRYIKAVAPILRDEYHGDIPETIEGLISLPGVGPKMAYLCMSAAWGRDEGIGVDVHVHRITNLWGWHKTREPEETRAVLESWLPQDRWHEINHMLVGFGQTICKPVGRDCSKCTLAEKGLCPSAVIDRKTVVKKKEKKVVVKDENSDEVEQVSKERVTIKEEELLAEEK